MRRKYFCDLCWFSHLSYNVVREAGGVTMDPAGGPLDIMSRRVLAASSKELADDFCKLLTQYYPTPRDD